MLILGDANQLTSDLSRVETDASSVNQFPAASGGSTQDNGLASSAKTVPSR